ncbi:MAG: 16S rRNA (uracil(1498)-N(3))-methyltransferase [Defluviitaleaceae bacterium]|nr:16S rRNA (uracil(1498)-N(3))-methyltransferase [Defluviitaleaceae bacterium]
MPKFFVHPDQINNGQIILSGDSAHHLVNVQRVRLNEKLLVGDGVVFDYRCFVAEIFLKPPSVLLKIICREKNKTEPQAKVTLYQSLLKGSSMDTAVQKCAEGGVHAIVPVVSARVEAPPPDKNKLARLNRISESAAGQSMRGIVPRIHPAVTFYEAINNSHEIFLAAYENAEDPTVSGKLNAVRNIKDIGLMVGPEGGFSDDEAKIIKDFAVTLGPRVLRAETAGLYALAQIFCMLGE